MDLPLLAEHATKPYSPMETKHKVYLIGGTSHAGKSTVAQALSDKLCWDYQPTDKLARHPGRPWRPDREPVKRFVAHHYLSHTPDELVASVIHHFKKNVWPLVLEIVTERATKPLTNCLVMEGAALLPDLVTQLGFENVASVWLTASDGFFRQRIHQSSLYEIKSEEEKELIDRFIERERSISQRTQETVSTFDLPIIDIEKYPDSKELERVVMSTLASQNQPRHADAPFE